MGITAESGPHISYGLTTAASSTGVTGQPADYNAQRAPDASDMGYGILDPRSAYNYAPGGDVLAKTFLLYNSRGYVDFVPSSASSNAFTISSNAAPVAGTALTLTPSSAKGTYSTTIIAPESGATVSVIAIDSTAAYLAFGTAGTINAWNPGAGTGRCISITTSSSGDAGTYSVAGRDMYGFKMTETVATSSIAFTTQKAFKYISSITASTTVTSTGVSIGLSDTFGFPLKVPYIGHDFLVRLNTTVYSSVTTGVAVSSASIILASTVATQTSTTPDVRGTYASSTASNGTVRLQIAVTPSASAVNAITAADVSPLFGGVQYSSV